MTRPDRASRSRQQRRKERTRTALIRTAQALLAAGRTDVPIAEIAQTADVGALPRPTPARPARPRRRPRHRPGHRRPAAHARRPRCRSAPDPPAPPARSRPPGTAERGATALDQRGAGHGARDWVSSQCSAFTCMRARTRRPLSGNPGGRAAHQLGSGGDPELREHVAQVVVDGARAEEQLGGNVFVGSWPRPPDLEPVVIALDDPMRASAGTRQPASPSELIGLTVLVVADVVWIVRRARRRPRHTAANTSAPSPFPAPSTRRLPGNGQSDSRPPCSDRRSCPGIGSRRVHP